MAEIDIYKRIFIFSNQQMEMQKTLSAKRGKLLKLGTVIVNGSPRVYTDIVTNTNENNFGDSIILLSGDIRKIKYTEPKDV